MEAVATTGLSDGTTFVWGCVGGFAALLVTQILPLAILAAKSGEGWEVTAWRVAGVLVVFVVFVAIGGVAALAIGDATKAGQAIVYGIGSQAFVAGLFKSGKAAVS